MAFPMLFGHMSFCTHRTWEVNVRRPTALAWKSWEKCHGKSVQRLHDSATFRHSLNLYLPQEQGVELSRDWLVLELPSDKLDGTPQLVFISPKGVRFDSLEAASQHITRASPPVALADPTTALDADSDTVQLPNLSLTTASYFDDWLHRGSGNILSTLPWYVYAIWVYRAERLSPSDPRSGQFPDVDFAPHYKLSEGYVQRLSLNPRVPQPEGMTLPTESQNPNGNAMYKSLLFRSFHASPMDPSTGETPDAFLCLHTSQEHPPPASCVAAEAERDEATDAAAALRAAADVHPQNPYESFSSQWRRYWRDTVLPEAAAARAKLQRHTMWESLWETCEI